MGKNSPYGRLNRQLPAPLSAAIIPLVSRQSSPLPLHLCLTLRTMSWRSRSCHLGSLADDVAPDHVVGMAALDALCAIISSSSQDLASSAITSIDIVKIFDAMLRLLDDQDLGVRAAACRGMGFIVKYLAPDEVSPLLFPSPREASLTFRPSCSAR